MSGRLGFQNEIEKLNVELIKMGALIEEAIENVIISLKTQDHSLAKEIIKKDREVDDMEKVIESHCLSLILRQQPVAKDLRIVSTALKMVTDMERIGDHASDIASIILKIDTEHFFEIVEHIPEMASIAKKMVNGAIEAFVKGDTELTKKIIDMDDKVDALFTKVKSEVIEILKKSNDLSDMCVDFLMIAKYFERIGDHAENICEWVEFNETGEYKNSRIL
ncbi:phosphate signaling complex protein PhoU [uncultured Tyzzerella sp.]|uniref:phosphate signaling complex protein PhoU n=1 Tax=uncultured Tyzzerella sp. TaxID=2321398 RepID=UPI002942FE08|nr:phosphate signaling complex protein PhoU [uncultured Tyzzerella sp.]